MGRRHRRGRAGGRLARSAAARVAARQRGADRVGHRPAGGRRGAGGVPGGQADGGGAPALLRRGDPCPQAAHRHRRRRRGRRGPPLALSSRAPAGRRRTRPARRAHPLALAAGPGRRPALGGDRPADRAAAAAHRGRSPGPPGPQRCAGLRPAELVRPDRPVARGAGVRRGRAAGPVALAGGDVREVRAALAAGRVRRCRGRRRGGVRHDGQGDPRGRRAGRRRRKRDRRRHRQAAGRDLGRPGLPQRLVLREAARPGREDGRQVHGLAQPARGARGRLRRGLLRHRPRPGPDPRPDRPRRARRRGTRVDRGHQDLQRRRTRGRPAPASAARGVPARRDARRVRRQGPDRAGGSGADPGRQGRVHRAGPRPDPAPAVGRPGPRMAASPGRPGGRGHDQPVLRGPARRPLPYVPGPELLPRPRERRPGHVISPQELAQRLGVPEPTPDQAAVIEAPLAPMAVIAGAGSGKSETMAARVVWLVANGLIRPERVLGLTFTRKAAAELSDRVRRRLGQLREHEDLIAPEILDGEPTVSTYHAYAARLFGDHALRAALEPTMRLITPAVAWQIAARVVDAYDGPMDAVEWAPDTVTKAVIGLAGELSEHLRTPDDVREIGAWLNERAAEVKKPTKKHQGTVLAAQAVREQLLPLVEAYQRAKAKREVFDHGDQLALAARIAREHREVGTIERSRYGVVLLDEYQDTSHAQLVLLKSLFAGGHPVTAVGDPCQSIYGWRGASAGNLLGFVRDFPEGDRPAPMRQLSTSFRNGERILDAAARIQVELREEAKDVPPLWPGAAPQARGRLECALLEPIGAGAGRRAARLAALLRQPREIAPDGVAWDHVSRHGPGVQPSDIAILARKRSQFPLLRAALEARGIPVEVVGLGGLLTVPEVQDVVATLKVVHDPSAGASLARLLTGPRWRLGPRDLVALGRRARDLAREAARDVHPDAVVPAEREAADPLRQVVDELNDERGSLVDALDDLGPADAYTDEGYARLERLRDELRILRRHVGLALPDLVTEVERTLGLDIEVAARTGLDPVTARADLDAFVDAAASFAGDAEDPTLGAFLAYLSAAESEEFGLEAGRVGETNSVKLLTVHAAKGLEWEVVAIPGLVYLPTKDGAPAKGSVFPTSPQSSSRWTTNARTLPYPLRGDRADLPGLPGLQKEDIETFNAATAERDVREERRLAYVAVTRAKHLLIT